MKNYLLAGFIVVTSVTLANACTTILVGNGATTDGSFIASRSEDGTDSSEVKQFVIHPRVEKQHGVTYRSTVNDFTYPMPDTLLRYTSMSAYTDKDTMGEAGFNEAGVGLSATETIFNNNQVLKIDPYLEKTGITEMSIENVILPQVHTAREGAALLGKIIEEKGTGEGFGVAFVDKKEMWYLETASGHQWMAVRVPQNAYFVSANQGRLRKYDPADSKNYMASKDLITFAVQHNFYKPSDGPFDFHKIYSEDTDHDVTYNYTRVWTLQHSFNENLGTDIRQGQNFPVFLQPQHKISIADVEASFRNHYQGTSHDPYTNNNPQEPYRPIAVFRTQEAHILQVRPNLPISIGEINYVAIGMPLLSVFIPYYEGAPHYLAGYENTPATASDNSIVWQYRKLQSMVMQDYNSYAPVVQKAYSNFERQTAQSQLSMEKEYLAVYKKDPKKAKQILASFEDKVSTDALNLTRSLINQVTTMMNKNVDVKYHFHGA